MSKIAFRNRAGLELAGNLELPPGGVWQATAIFAHCFTCSRNIKAARNITRALADAGFAVLRFDLTGLGESKGDFSDTTFSSNLDDLEDASGWMTEHYSAPQLLVGHSLGGAAILAVAERLDSVRAVATLAAPVDPIHVLKQLGNKLEDIERNGSAEVSLAGRPFRIRQDFIEDARQHPLEDRLRRLRRALLVMHAPRDTAVSISNAQQIFAAALHPKSFVSLDEADHLLTDEADSRYAGGVIAAWGSRFLRFDLPAPVDGVHVTGLTADKFLCRVQAGSHVMTADEPAGSGGNDLGPDPYRFLAASLGSCTVMTLNMYARRKGLKVEKVNCEVTHDRIHADDCEDCENTSRKIDRLTRTISIEGELDGSEQERMLEIADRCPVHQVLEKRILIESHLAKATSQVRTPHP